MSSTLILHNYPISPYSQKIRAMLGYTDLDWQSVRTAEAPPRPELEPLTGGYRKIPVAQIGADVFCDTRTIAREIAERAQQPALQVEQLDDEAVALMRRAEDELFFACGLAAASLTMVLKMLKQFSWSEYVHFMKDRMAMNKDATVPFPGMRASKQRVLAHLQDIESRLQQDFLFGDAPNLVDFCVYHGLWMVHRLGEKRFMRRFPRTLAWMDRIDAFGCGNSTPLEATAALDVARDAEPRPVAEAHRQDPAVGHSAAIAPADYARDSTRGELVAVTPATWVLRRQHPRVGTVHVHFPREGFDLSTLD